MIRRVLRCVALLAGSVLVACVTAEVAVRLLDGYPVTAVVLPPFPLRLVFAAPPPPRLATLATRLGGAPDTDPAWIDEAPPPLPNRAPPDPELLAARAAVRRPNVQEYDLYSAWNRLFVDATACVSFSPLPLLPMPIVVYDPPEPIPRPPYRHLPSRTTPKGLTTNRFGWRGADIPLDKPGGTVRIAFVGASTTVGLHEIPFSYPEYVVHWLNRWAERTGRPVRFDGINAGRGGLVSSDIAAVVRQEVLPMEPDLIVYYEGANQFVFAAPLTDAGPDPLQWAKGKPPATWQRFDARFARFSALVRRADRAMRIVAARGGKEPTKPPYELRWPAGVDVVDPDIARPDLPLALPVILGDLDAIRSASAARGTELAVGSFVWLASEGLRLDPIRQGLVYYWLNEKCWPYRYADLRRLVDFENLVLRRWATARDVLFVDFAGSFPMDPELFVDSVHLTSDGTRVQAWLAFQALLPRVRERLDAGTWPRPDREPLAEHPGFGPLRRFVVPCAR
jgi:hypothetical protein